MAGGRGAGVKPGDVIAEIETDKATMEVEAVDEGKVSKILVPEGTEGVKVNTPIALLDGEGAPRRTAPAVERQRLRQTPSSREPSPTSPRRARARSGSAARAPSPRSRPAPRPSPRPCARRCATPWPRRCGATRTCS